MRHLFGYKYIWNYMTLQNLMWWNSWSINLNVFAQNYQKKKKNPQKKIRWAIIFKDQMSWQTQVTPADSHISCLLQSVLHSSATRIYHFNKEIIIIEGHQQHSSAAHGWIQFVLSKYKALVLSLAVFMLHILCLIHGLQQELSWESPLHRFCEWLLCSVFSQALEWAPSKQIHQN